MPSPRFAGSWDRFTAGPRVRGLTRGCMPSPASRVRASGAGGHHGFADSPVGACRHPLRGLVGSIHGRSTGSRTHPWLHAVTRFAGSWDRFTAGPRVRGLTRGCMPSPASRVGGIDSRPVHGFADSPVAACRHPLRGFVGSIHGRSTGSRTHPWLHAVTRFAGWWIRFTAGPRVRGFTWLHDVTRFAGWSDRFTALPRVRGLTRGYMPSPASRVRTSGREATTGSRTHPWLYAVTRFAGWSDRFTAGSTGSRTHPWLHAVTRFAGSRVGAGGHHGFADSPVATCRHPLRGFAPVLRSESRIRRGRFAIRQGLIVSDRIANRTPDLVPCSAQKRRARLSFILVLESNHPEG